MLELFDRLFVPPPCPAFDIGWGAKATGARDMIESAFKAAYFVGVKDGFMAGVLATFAFLAAVALVIWWKQPVRPHA